MQRNGEPIVSPITPVAKKVSTIKGREKIRQIKAALAGIVESFDEEHKRLMEEYQEKDDDGQPIFVDEEKKFVRMKEGWGEALNQALHLRGDEEVVLDVHTLSEADLGDGPTFEETEALGVLVE